MGWRLWRLAEPLIYEVGGRGSGRVILVSKGFITDGPSIPRLLWSILPVWASWSRAGVVHDYLCYLIALNNPHPEAPTRDHADRIFFEAMEAPQCRLGSEVPALLGRTLWDLVQRKAHHDRPQHHPNATQVVRR